MIEAALPLDMIPMVGVIVGRQILDRARHEVGNDGIQRHAAAGDQNAGLTCRAETWFLNPRACISASIDNPVYIFPAEQVGPDRPEHRLPVRLMPLAIGVSDRGDAHVMQRHSGDARGGNQIVFVTQQVVQPRGEVKSHLKGPN